MPAMRPAVNVVRRLVTADVADAASAPVSDAVPRPAVGDDDEEEEQARLGGGCTS
jgi:hypothetical protein